MNIIKKFLNGTIEFFFTYEGRISSGAWCLSVLLGGSFFISSVIMLLVNIIFLVLLSLFNFFVKYGLVSSLAYDRVDHFVGGLLFFSWIGLALYSFTCLNIKRLHDLNKKGTFAFLFAVPILGWLPAMYFGIKEGEKSENKYGKSPNSH